MANDYDINTTAQALDIHVGGDDEGRAFISFAIEAARNAMGEVGRDMTDPTIRDAVERYVWESIDGSIHLTNTWTTWQTWVDLRMYHQPDESDSTDMTARAQFTLASLGQAIAASVIEEEGDDGE